MRYLKSFLFLAIILSIIACREKPSPNTLIVGTMAGPESDVIAVAQTIAQSRYGLTIKIIEFSDYNLPNAALQDGTLDLNIFQHGPYLEDANKAHHYSLEAIGKTFLYPMAIYSNKLTALKDLRDGAIIAIPNDPSNEGRALLLLEKAGLIKLKAGVGFEATPEDIMSNPRQLKMITLAAAQLPRALDDVSVAAINTNYAELIGLSVKKDALFRESADSPYANLIVVRKGDQDNPKIKTFVKAMQSPEVKAAAKKWFGDGAVQAWK